MFFWKVLALLEKKFLPQEELARVYPTVFVVGRCDSLENILPLNQSRELVTGTCYSRDSMYDDQRFVTFDLTEIRATLMSELWTSYAIQYTLVPLPPEHCTPYCVPVDVSSSHAVLQGSMNTVRHILVGITAWLHRPHELDWRIHAPTWHSIAACRRGWPLDAVWWVCRE